MFPYLECQKTMLDDLVNALQENRDRIAGMVAQEDWNVDAVCYDVLPWHPFICLSFRFNDDETGQEYRYSPADWKYYEFIGDGAFGQTRELAGQLYASPPEGMKQNAVAHLLYMAAAEALLDPSVAKLLQFCGIDAPVLDGKEMTGGFEYLVLDEDRVISANYCEVILATRWSKYLLKKSSE